MIYIISFFVCSTLSLISTSVLLFSFAYFKTARTYAFKLVFPIFVFDFLLSLNYFCSLLYDLISDQPWIGNFLCILQGFIKLLATNGMFFSTLIISWVLYSHFVKKKPIRNKNPILLYSPFTVGLPLLIALTPLITNNYNHTEPLIEVMCFLIVKHTDKGETDTVGMVFKILLSFVPFLLTIILEMYFISRILYDFWRNKEENQFANFKSLVLYPLFLVFSWIWIMYERFYELITEGQQIIWLNQFDLQIGVFNGFINSLIYGYISINPCGKNSISNQQKVEDIEEKSENNNTDEWSLEQDLIK